MSWDWERHGFEIFRGITDDRFKWSTFSAFQNFDTYEREKVMKRWWGDKHRLNPHYYFQEYRDLITSKPVQDAAWRYFPGKRMYVTHSKISLKEPGKDGIWYPHQDSGYKGKKVEGFTCAIFLETCTKENGTLELAPGSHKLGRLPHERIPDNQVRIFRSIIRNMEFLPISRSRGDILFFHFDTVHRSGINYDGKSKRLIFLFEVQVMEKPTLDEAGRFPIVFGEPLRLGEKVEAVWRQLWK